MRRIIICLVFLLCEVRVMAVGFNEVPWVKYTQIDSFSYLGCSSTASVDAECSIALADSMTSYFSLYARAEANVGGAGEAGAGEASAKVTATVTKMGFFVEPPFVFKVNGSSSMGGGGTWQSQGHNIMAQGISSITLCINGSWVTVWSAAGVFFMGPNVYTPALICTTLTSGNITGAKVTCIANAWSITYHSGGDANASNSFGINAMDIEHIGVEETSNLDFGFGNGELKAFPNPFTSNTVISYSGNKSPNNYYTNTLLTIYDISGKLVKTFPLFSGQSSFAWDGKDNNGKETEAGIYFVKAQDKLTKIIKLK
jgi:hypothetical protein